MRFLFRQRGYAGQARRDGILKLIVDELCDLIRAVYIRAFD